MIRFRKRINSNAYFQSLRPQCGSSRSVLPEQFTWPFLGEIREVPIVLLPILTDKKMALRVLFGLSDLLLTHEASENEQSIGRVQEEIANCSLPEESL